MGRTRFLLVALLGVLATPASAFAGTVPRRDDRGARPTSSPASATITGSIDPRGQPASYRFDLGPTIAYGSSTPTRALTVTTPTTVSEKLAALTPGTTYHYPPRRDHGVRERGGARRDVHARRSRPVSSRSRWCRSSSRRGRRETPRSTSPDPTATGFATCRTAPRATSTPRSRPTAGASCSRARGVATATCTSSTRTAAG